MTPSPAIPLPCPFCGNMPIVDDIVPADHLYRCPCHAAWKTLPQWNTRPTQDARVEALLKAGRYLCLCYGSNDEREAIKAFQKLMDSIEGRKGYWDRANVVCAGHFDMGAQQAVIGCDACESLSPTKLGVSLEGK